MDRFLKNKNFNLKYIISYVGLLPYIYILLDLNFFNLLSLYFLKEFIIFYSLLIFTFIGAMRWYFYINTNSLITIYDFILSFASTILIFFILLNINKNLILSVVGIFFIFQLIGDYILYKKNKDEGNFFLNLRVPASFFILANIFYLISV